MRCESQPGEAEAGTGSKGQHGPGSCPCLAPSLPPPCARVCVCLSTDSNVSGEAGNSTPPGAKFGRKENSDGL